MVTIKITYSDGRTQILSFLDDEPLRDLAECYNAESVEILEYEL